MTAPPRTPYQDTSVSVEKSKEQIRQALKSAGAMGVQFDELWEPEVLFVVRFLWRPKNAETAIRVRLQARPLPPSKTRRVGSTWQGRTVTEDQRERQAWRGMAWYIKTMLEAAQFKLLRFEDVFLSFVEDDSGRTIGEHIIPMLEQGRLALPKGGGS